MTVDPLARAEALATMERMFDDAVRLWNQLLLAHTGKPVWDGTDFPEREDVETIQRTLTGLLGPGGAA